MRFRLIIVLLSISLAGCSYSPQLIKSDCNYSFQNVEELFEKFVALSDAYDPSLGCLFAGDCVIKMIQHDLNGRPEELVVSGFELKANLDKIMASARKKGSLDKYSNVTFNAEGINVRVNAIRYSVLQDYYSPYSMLIGPDSHGNLVIKEIVANFIKR